jgi:hypothetical protein
MKKNILRITAFLLILIIVFPSCESDEASVNPDNKSIQESTMTESAVNDVVALVNSGASLKSMDATTCGDFVFDQASNSLTISFPQNGCTGEDGVTRSGVIHAQFTGTWQEVGSTVVVTFDGYKRDGIELSGTITMNFTAGGALPAFTVTSANMSLTFEDGSTITWTGSTSYTYNGLNTPLDLSDDYFEISGATGGTTKEGKSFAQVATNLQTSASCKWFVSGNLKITVADSSKTDVYDLTFKEPCGTVDVTYNGIPFTINLDE